MREPLGHRPGAAGRTRVVHEHVDAPEVRTERAPVILYDAPGCWKCVEVADALDALGLPYRSVTVRGDPVARATLVAAQGEPPQVPMLVDGPVAVWDRRRILAYLAETYGGAAPGEDGGFRAMPGFMGGVCTVDGPCAEDGAPPPERGDAH